jgi:endonuclease YncB( thermonuclease family)
MLPNSFAGQVTSVPNGAVLMVRNQLGTSQAVRLFGVGAPLEGQAFFSESRDGLAQVAPVGSFVQVHQMGLDPVNGTVIAKVFLGDGYVNRTQLNNGMSWYYVEHGLDTDLAEAEMAAQEAGRGIWGDPELVSQWAYGP